jgi:hypothetical protein
LIEDPKGLAGLMQLGAGVKNPRIPLANQGDAATFGVQGPQHGPGPHPGAVIGGQGAIEGEIE